MNHKVLKISDVILFKPKVYKDNRGYFFESFNQKVFENIVGINYQFVQDNHSFSKKNVFRGLHFQIPPFEQGKLVKVISGEILDIVVDLRNFSKTYGKSIIFKMNSKNHEQVWIPPGLAHGFFTLTESVISYKVTKKFSKKHQRTIHWNDSNLKIELPINKKTIISQKDLKGIKFNNKLKYFTS